MISAARRALLNTGWWPGRQADVAKAVHKTKNLLHAVYDFSKLGGAVGSYSLLDTDGDLAKLPTAALITNVFTYTETALASGGAATLALTAESAGDLKAATAYTSFSAGAKVQGVPVSDDLSTSVLTTAERTLTAAVATAALTAGKVHFFVEYVHAKGT